jgi:hypothetical protein
VLAEECEWRAGQAGLKGGSSWYPETSQIPEWLHEGNGVPNPSTIAGLYRELRKGREDTGNQPAASDFYYGEMEMRRHDSSLSGAERAILWVYWAASGYALRASRAFGWLLLILVVFALLFDLFGFASVQPAESALAANPSFVTALFTAFTATVFRSIDGINLTFVGELLSALLRIIGPLLLGLTILSIRGRVKR